MANIIDVQFRQIDFLRLFRLCKDIGIVNRKRKMPTEYHSDSERKNACKRLISLVAKEVFKDGFEIYVGYTSVQIRVSNNLNIQLRQVMRDVNRGYDYSVQPAVILPAEIQTKLDHFMEFTGNFGNGHIALSFPASITANYKSYTEGASRRESFYRCAVDCIAFRKYWDENIPLILEAHAKAKEQAVNKTIDLKKLQDKAQEQERQQQQETQRRFNEALTTYMTNRGV